MKTLKHGDRVKILTGHLFKGREATVDLFGKIDGRRMYRVITNTGMYGWYKNSELELINDKN